MMNKTLVLATVKFTCKGGQDKNASFDAFLAKDFGHEMVRPRPGSRSLWSLPSRIYKKGIEH